MGQRLEALNEHLTRVIDLRRATSVLDWDQEVYMPEEGAVPRSQAQATLTTMAHEIFTSDTTRSLLEAAEAEVADLDFDSDEASTVHEGGHALYELGSPDKFERTLLAGGSTLGLHESQSRLWAAQGA